MVLYGVFGAVCSCFNVDLLALSMLLSVTFSYVAGEFCGKKDFKRRGRTIV